MKTTKHIALFLLGLMFIGTSCKKNNQEPADPTDPTDPTSDISLQIQQELDEGKDFYDMVTEYGTTALYGKKYEGGLIYHIDVSESWGYVVSETELSTSARWGCPGLWMVETWYSGIGSDGTNSVIIIMDCMEGGIAAGLCRGSELGGYDNWNLPTTGSMSAIYERIASKDIGNFSNDLYWTSTGRNDDQDRAFAFSFETGNETPKNRGDEYSVRAVRKFEY